MLIELLQNAGMCERKHFIKVTLPNILAAEYLELFSI